MKKNPSKFRYQFLQLQSRVLEIHPDFGGKKVKVEILLLVGITDHNKRGNDLSAQGLLRLISVCIRMDKQTTSNHMT